MDGQKAFEIGVEPYACLYPHVPEDMTRRQTTDVDPRVPDSLPLEGRTVRRRTGLRRGRTL